MRIWQKIKEYRQELVAFCDLELFVWAITRRYYNRPTVEWRRMMLDGVITLSGIALGILTWRLSRKWRRRSSARLREFSHKLLKKLSERVLLILERWQSRRGRGAGDILGGRTRIEYDLFGRRRQRREKRVGWKQLESEQARIRWLYACMIENRLRRGHHIRPSDTPDCIAAREDSAEAEVELIGIYTDCRYNRPHEMPDGVAGRWRDRNT